MNLVRTVQEKRALEYKPRMGRRSDDNELPKPYDVLFTPRMGKRADLLTNFTPRMGRSTYSGSLQEKSIIHPFFAFAGFIQ